MHYTCPTPSSHVVTNLRRAGFFVAKTIGILAIAAIAGVVASVISTHQAEPVDHFWAEYPVADEQPRFTHFDRRVGALGKGESCHLADGSDEEAENALLKAIDRPHLIQRDAWIVRLEFANQTLLADYCFARPEIAGYVELRIDLEWIGDEFISLSSQISRNHASVLALKPELSHGHVRIDAKNKVRSFDLELTAFFEGAPGKPTTWHRVEPAAPDEVCGVGEQDLSVTLWERSALSSYRQDIRIEAHSGWPSIQVPVDGVLGEGASERFPGKDIGPYRDLKFERVSVRKAELSND